MHGAPPVGDAANSLCPCFVMFTWQPHIPLVPTPRYSDNTFDSLLVDVLRKAVVKYIGESRSPPTVQDITSHITHTVCIQYECTCVCVLWHAWHWSTSLLWCMCMLLHILVVLFVHPPWCYWSTLRGCVISPPLVHPVFLRRNCVTTP